MPGRERKFWRRRSTAWPARPRASAARRAEERDVRAPEAVDRLLGVAHHHQAARARPRPGGPRSRPAAGPCPGTRRSAGSGSGARAWRRHGLAVAQGVARLHQQVDEVEHARAALLRLVAREHAPRGCGRARACRCEPRAPFQRVSASMHPADQCARVGRAPRPSSSCRAAPGPCAAGARARGAARSASPVEEPAGLREGLDAAQRVQERVALDHRLAQRARAGPPAPPARRARPRDRASPRRRAARRSRCQSSVRARPRSDWLSPQPATPISGISARTVSASTGSEASRRSCSHSSQASAKSASDCASSAWRKPGVHAALERTLLQDGRAERVDGRDLRPLQGGQRAPAARSLRSGASSVRARARSSRSRSRSFRVAAAFSVKVTAAISVTSASPSRSSDSMRSTSSVVLPVPAPASRTSVSPREPRVRSRSSRSDGTKLIATPAGAGTRPGAGRPA